MDLKELRYFRAIVECGTFSKAAAYLRIAQPALSRQIQKLEHDLGVELLLRTSRGISVTPAGAALLRRTSTIEQDLKAARREAQSYAGDVSGTLRVSVQYPVSTLMLPDIIAEYGRQFPHVFIQMNDAYSAGITDAVLTGELDVALVDMPTHPHVDIVTIPMWVDRVVLIAPPSARNEPLFAGKTSVDMADIVHLPFVLPSQNSTYRRMIDRTFARRHLSFKTAFDANGVLINFAMVEKGLAYSMFPETAVRASAEAGQIIAFAIEPPILRTTCLMTRVELLNERSVSHFIELATDMIGRMIRDGRFGPATLYEQEHDKPAAVAK